MGTPTRKAISFDFDTHSIADNLTAMGDEGPYEKYRRAYYEVSEYLSKKGFSRPQYSGYTSDKPISIQEVKDIVGDLTDTIPYLEGAIKCFQISSVVGRTYDVTDMVSNEHNSELIKPENLYKLESSYGIKVNDEKEERRHIRFDY